MQTLTGIFGLHAAGQRRRPLKSLVALAAVLAGWGARVALTPLIGPTALPFITFFPAVAWAAWYGGLLPAVLTTVGGALVANWFFLEPRG
ncbi:MAG TPA: DUF4118 domain-containing protein, partial [Planctomycetota bacterium]|nr:DUF4118 domain-containing protein [Planctomycetota bacterium]